MRSICDMKSYGLTKQEILAVVPDGVVKQSEKPGPAVRQSDLPRPVDAGTGRGDHQQGVRRKHEA